MRKGADHLAYTPRTLECRKFAPSKKTMASVYIAQRKPYTLAVMVYNGLELKTLTRRQVSAMVVLGGRGRCPPEGANVGSVWHTFPRRRRLVLLRSLAKLQRTCL